MSTIATLLILCALSASTALGADRVTGKPFATRSEVIARNGMAATSQPLATQVALDILKAGGSAVDAAIAANATLALMEPTGCGLGGDLFAIVWDGKEQKLSGLNASGRSPASLSLAEFERLGLTSIPKYGPLPVSVPGCVDGWFELHERFGKLPMEQLLQPAIDYAEAGFPVTELIAYYWDLSVPKLSPYPGFVEQFTLEGRAPRKGEVFANPNLANTLRLLAKDGREAFYRGPIAKTIDAYMKRHGGFLSFDDLAAHESEWVEPVGFNYRGYELWELPPNGQGIAALQILAVLEGYDLAQWGFGSLEYVHHFVEAKKLAFEDRARFYADPDFAPNLMGKSGSNGMSVERLISREYASERRKLIDGKVAARSYAPGDARLQDGDTIYLTTADKEGNMVSLIQSNYRGMGSGMAPDGLGFILQDRGELFDLTPGRANTFAPKKRPFHTIIPAFVTREGKPFMSFGVMGGGTQPQAHAQIIVNIVDFGMNVQEAGDAPRILHVGSSEPTGTRMTDGGTVSLETGFSYEVQRELAKRKHKLQLNVGSFGGYQAIRVDPETGVYYGASESRKDGQAGGY